MNIDIFQQQPVLENERVLLRPIEENDFENLLPFSLNEPDTWFYGLVTAAGEENLKTYLANAIKNRNEKKEFAFIVYDKKAKAYAGSTRFYDINTTNITSQLGFTWYGKNFQRTGLNRHCKLLLLTTPSINAMKAIGCIEEGIFRNHMPTSQGGRRDSIVLSILKDEWFGGVNDRLSKLAY